MKLIEKSMLLLSLFNFMPCITYLLFSKSEVKSIYKELAVDIQTTQLGMDSNYFPLPSKFSIVSNSRYFTM